MLHWTLPQINTDVIRITITPTASAKTVTLSNFTLPINCAVEWGDGTTVRITTNTAISHTYTDTKPRQIVLRGILGGFWSVASATGKNLVTSVDEISSKSLLTMSDTFRNCTGLTKIQSTLTCPSVTNFVRAFYQCRSITSVLPTLWTTNKNATHTNCFTQCFKTMYGQYGTNCPQRQYVAAVAGQTYYQKYSTSCPAASYNAGTAATTYYNQYGTNCSNTKLYAIGATVPYSLSCGDCGGILSAKVTDNVYECTLNQGTANATESVHVYGHKTSCKRRSTLVWNSRLDCENGYWKHSRCTSACKKIYSNGSGAYYSCSQSSASGIGTCGSGCKRTYTSGQSAYYKCKKSGGTCQTSNCAYPYANEASFNAAKSAGWA